MPIAPPTAAMTVASSRNCKRMSSWRAPRALRMPISRVRSVTVASITFMMTTPPMTRKTETTPTMAVAIAPVKFFHNSMSVAWSKMPKLSFSLGERCRRARIMARASSWVCSIHLEISLDWDVGKIVLRLTEGRADRVRDADNQERPAINQEFVANGIKAGEKLNGQVVANHSDLGPALIVTLGDVAAVARCDDVDVHHVGGDAADIGVVESMRAGAHFSIDAQLHANAERQLHIVAQRFEVVPGNLFVAAVGLHVLVDVGNDGEASQQKNVGAHIGDAVGDVAVHAGDQGDDHNERGNRQDDAQEHQEGAHFVGAQGLQGHTDWLSEHNPAFHACVSPAHSTRKSLKRFRDTRKVLGLERLGRICGPLLH